MAGMMKQVQKMQKDMAKMQDELKNKTIDVSTGGGAVKITMNGEKKVTAISIDKAAVDPDDVEMLQDLLCAAFNDAAKRVDDMMAEEMGKLTSALGIPAGLF
ncbi:MAG: YbaB/EbfC family nucleoid-associated protein [Selenomonadaceae bacterium]|nr:YbaB/EbfC family nucleoid-associated protein [Selenomonadaceae bacterium]